MYPAAFGRSPEPRGEGVAASIGQQGARVDGMASRSEPSVNAVIITRPKML